MESQATSGCEGLIEDPLVSAPMADFKKNHFVQAAYLAAWCDPETPVGHEPYVWLFSKDGRKARRKAPHKLFYEKDLYVRMAEDGSRDTELERSFHDLETRLPVLRTRIEAKEDLSDEDLDDLRLYVAVQQSRHPAWGKRLAESMGEVAQLAKRIKADIIRLYEKADPKIEATMNAVLNKQGVSVEAIEAARDNPFHLFTWELAGQFAAMFRSDFALVIGSAPKSRGFITSDRPSILVDSAMDREASVLPPGLVDPAIAVFFPVTPNLAVILHKKRGWPASGYASVSEQQTDSFNSGLANGCVEAFVFNKPSVAGLTLGPAQTRPPTTEDP